MTKMKILTGIILVIIVLSVSSVTTTANVADYRWEDLQPASMPIKSLYILGYDIESDLTIAFYYGFSERVYAYNANTNAWTSVVTSTPAHLLGITKMFAYHPVYDAFIFFGGSLESGMPYYGVDYTYAYFYNNNSWKDLNPSVSPPARIYPHMVYDSAHDKIVMFGGMNNFSSSPNHNYEDVWTYDVATNTWANVTPSVNPAGRVWGSATYDSDANRTLLFGGMNQLVYLDRGGYYNDLWEFDLNTTTWTQLSPLGTPPSPRAYTIGAYDSNASKTIIFGGASGKWDVAGSAYRYSDTFIYDYATNTWTKYACDTSPKARDQIGLAFNSKLNITLLCGGGSDDEMEQDTWQFYMNSALPCVPEFSTTTIGFLTLISASLMLSPMIMMVRKRKKA